MSEMRLSSDHFFESEFERNMSNLVENVFI